jgi:hypothetical protein
MLQAKNAQQRFNDYLPDRQPKKETDASLAVLGARLCAVGELANCPPGTEAKFITKSRS